MQVYLIGYALGAVLSVLGGGARAAGTDAAVAYQINVAHSGVQPDNSLSPPLLLRWQVSLPALVSYPLIAGGRVFVTAADGTNSVPTLYALNQGSGEILWSRAVPSPPPFNYPWANAAYEGGRIFVIGTAGVMTAYDAATGTQLWSTPLPFQYLFSSPPTAAGGVVYAGGAGSGGTVYAVDQLTGTVLATQTVMNGDHSSPAIAASGVFVSYACNQAYGFARNTLQLSWHHTTFCEGGGGKTVVYENSRVYTRDFFGNLILDAATGNLLGNYGPTMTSPGIVAPAVRGNTVWLLNGGSLSAQDMTTPSSPSTLWTFNGDGLLVTAPILLATPGGDYVIEGSASGTLYALDATTGDVVWSTDVGAAINQPDEQNISQPLTGLGAGEGLLVVPAGRTISAFSGTAPPAPAATPVPTLSRPMFGLLALLLSSLAFCALRRGRAWPRRG
jgi:outer membrane protein assembly factor BamB